MKDFNKEKDQKAPQQLANAPEGNTLMPPAFQLKVDPVQQKEKEEKEEKEQGVLQAKEAPIQMAAGDNYEDGNRPNPSNSTGRTYEIQSNRPSIMTTGQSVNYSLRQIQTTVRSADSQLTVRWRVQNGATGNGAPATIDGPQNSWSWNTLRARVPGVHTIQAIISLNGRVIETVSFTQVVENGDTEFADVGNVRPAPLNNMGDFIALVERIEAAYPGYAWQDVATKIRKQFYPGPGNAESSRLMAAFTWDDLIDEQQHVAPLQSPPCRAADIAALNTNSSIGGIDIGHVLTGVDSMNFPETAGMFSLHGTSGPAAATWSGDVGSALVQWANQAGLSDQTGARREEFYNRFSSVDDLLGDFDGINIAEMPSLGPNAPLSARLRTYYQTQSSESSNRRYHRFCQVSGLTVTNGRLSASARAYIRDQVNRFAQAFNVRGSVRDAMIMTPMGGSGGVYIPPAGNYEMTTGHMMAENLGWFVDRFIRDVEAGLASE